MKRLTHNPFPRNYIVDLPQKAGFVLDLFIKAGCVLYLFILGAQIEESFCRAKVLEAGKKRTYELGNFTLGVRD